MNCWLVVNVDRLRRKEYYCLDATNYDRQVRINTLESLPGLPIIVVNKLIMIYLGG